MPPSSLLDYFPEAKGDGLRVSWAAEVNTKARLTALLMGPTMILEGDVCMAANSRYPVPMLADLTLEEWLLEVTAASGGNRKGVRLNFRSTEVVEPACRVLARLWPSDRVNLGPLILHADVLGGTVDTWTFLTLARTRFPHSFISLGWDGGGSGCFLGYSHEMTERMLALIKEYSLAQPVMFPASAGSIAASVPEVQRLLFHVPSSSLVVTAPASGPGDLPAIRASFPRGQVFYSLPDHHLHYLSSVT